MIDVKKLFNKGERGTHKGKVKVTRGGKTFYREQMVGRKGAEKDKKFTTSGWNNYFLDNIQVSEDKARKYVDKKVVSDLTGKKMNDKKLSEYAKNNNFPGAWVILAYDKIKIYRSSANIERDIKRVEEQSIKRITESRAQGGSAPGGGAMDRDLQRFYEKVQILKDELKRAKKQESENK